MSFLLTKRVPCLKEKSSHGSGPHSFPVDHGRERKLPVDANPAGGLMATAEKAATDFAMAVQVRLNGGGGMASADVGEDRAVAAEDEAAPAPKMRTYETRTQSGSTFPAAPCM